jgi:cyclopropane fatty-acyl-phospholipid synthase-like methyltransferase
MSERFHATGIDIPAAQIERARENVPEARLLHGDLLAADFGEEFDAIAAFYVVDHVERERHASIFERFHRWLRPSGWLLLSIEPEAEPGSVGFEVVEQAVEPQLEGERPVFFLWVLARKARLTSTP